MNITGWRKPTPELCKANEFAQTGEGLSIPKSQALISVKRIASKIGLRATDLMLLDLLCAFSKPQDWSEGCRPIVWPSNQFLAEQMGLSERAIQRHCKKLGELGLIAFKDNANGQRRGRRNNDGYIIEAYGFDLSPLQARAGEFELLYEEINAERQFKKLMRKHITISRRAIRTMIHMALENNSYDQTQWHMISDRLDQLIETIPNHKATSQCLSRVAQCFIDFHQEIKQIFDNIIKNIKKEDKIGFISSKETSYNIEEKQAEVNHKLSSTDDKNDIPILTTKTNNKFNSIEDKSQNFEQEDNHKAYENKKAAIKFNYIPHQNSENLENTMGKMKDRFSTVTPELLLKTCPEFFSYASILNSNLIKNCNWYELLRVSDQLHPSIGIPQSLWDKAKHTIGANSATIALGLIFEKYNAQEIKIPAAYLFALIKRAEKGELHLTKSIYGRLSSLNSKYDFT